MSQSPSVPEITPLELAQTLELGRRLQVVDVRAPARVALGHVEPGPGASFHNLVGSRLRLRDSLDGTGLDPTVPIAVVCGHGNDSKVVARHLIGLGADAKSLRGGMAAWMNLTLPRELAAPETLDRFVQFDRIGKGALGYLLVSDGAALVVDPPRDASAYLEAVAASGVGVVGVADTHVHADYISGGPALGRSLGVPYYLHPADMVFPYDGTRGTVTCTPIADGDTIRVGRCAIRVAYTPGHTEGSVTYVVDNHVALTGDFIFVASIGRPDLAGKTREWSAQLWESLETARRSWSPDLTVYPGHYASDAERRPDRSVGAQFGVLLRENAALRILDRSVFAAWVEQSVGAFPESYRTIKAINVGLLDADERRAEELEVGRNECALGGVAGR
jgi:glyoxylase-like metal-dependent hydrolase (beta-lactamase superfamily II)